MTRLSHRVVVAAILALAATGCAMQAPPGKSVV